VNKLLDSRLLRQRLETFLNFPRGGVEVCCAVYQRPFRSRPMISCIERGARSTIIAMQM